MHPVEQTPTAHGEAAVDAQNLSRGPCRQVGQEKCHRGAYVLGLAETRCRYPREDHVLELLGHGATVRHGPDTVLSAAGAPSRLMSWLKSTLGPSPWRATTAIIARPRCSVVVICRGASLRSSGYSHEVRR